MTLDDRLRSRNWSDEWDVIVIGGGATGLGAAVDAASRGFRTLLVERGDFAQGTSSRSTKLVHGGVRYLEQLNFTLVSDALRERGAMFQNAPHLVHAIDFIIPVYSNIDKPYYGIGLKVYEWLAGRRSLGPSHGLSPSDTAERLPTVRREGLKGGILYRDGQFDDARYAIALARTLEELGGVALNYVRVDDLIIRNARVTGIKATELESGEHFAVSGKVVINATGVFADRVCQMDPAPTLLSLAISRGSHIVLPKAFLPGKSALMIPKTDDGRILFAIPWHDHVLVGTTDEPAPRSDEFPQASEAEKDFLLKHLARYLQCEIRREHVLSVWAGLRPLMGKGNLATSKLSRDHQVSASASGLITVIGGKWTTYRRMGEDAVTAAIAAARLPDRPSGTLHLKLHGWNQSPRSGSASPYRGDLSGTNASEEDSGLDVKIHAALPYSVGEVISSVRCEYARTTEDVLARRTRALLLNAQAAIESAPEVSRIVAREIGRDEVSRIADLTSFLAVAGAYRFTN